MKYFKHLMSVLLLIIPIWLMGQSEHYTGDGEQGIDLESIVKPPFSEIEPPSPEREFGVTPKFVAYEEAPVILRRVNPTYPDMARRMGIQGTVVLDVEVLSDGTIGAIEVLQSVQSGPGGLDEAAINTVRQFRIQPAKSGGSSIACWIRMPINFTY